MLLDLCLFALFLSSLSLLSVSKVGSVPSESLACEASADRPACLNLSDSLVIPVDFDGSVVIMDEKGSLGANYTGVCMVVKLGTAFSLASRSRKDTQPGILYGSYCSPVGHSPASCSCHMNNQAG